MHATHAVIEGRDREVAVVSAFLDGDPDGPTALVLEGPPGIGKSTLWQVGVDHARDTGHLVLTTRAAEAEARLAYAGLGDLFGGLPSSAFGAVPSPVRAALESALLRGDASGARADPRAVGLAVTEVIQGLAATQPLLVAIEDLQWLDRSTARVLAFALRRSTSGALRVLASQRVGNGAPADPIDLGRAISATDRLMIGPLAPESLGRILRNRAQAAFPHPVVARLHRVTDGNPLFALEIARAVVRAGASAGDSAEWAVPDDLQRLLSARLAALPADARQPLLAIAATAQPTWELCVAFARDPSRSIPALATAEQAGIIERADGRVRFSHPLLGSTLYVNASNDERRAVHARLASMLTDPEEQARHLALAADGPDSRVADALDRAASHARARGATDAAAELADLAAQLTPPGAAGDFNRRRVAAAEHHFDAGDVNRALSLLRETIEAMPVGRDRAEALYRLASMSWLNVRDVRMACQQALAEAGDDTTLLCGLHSNLAWVAFNDGDLEQAFVQSSRAVELSTKSSDRAARADALATLYLVQFHRGVPAGDLTEAIALEDLTLAEGSWTTGSVYTPPRIVLGLAQQYAGRLDDARATFQHELAVYERRGMYTIRQEVLSHLSDLETRAGNWTVAEEHAREALEIVVESGHAGLYHPVAYMLARAAAHRGDTVTAQRDAAEALRLAESNEDAFISSLSQALLGFIGLATGDLQAARLHLEAAAAYAVRVGFAQPGMIPCLPDLVEVLVRLADLDEAKRILAILEDQANRCGEGWARGTALRARALVVAASGDIDVAQRAAEASVAELERSPQPFETARSWLVLGQVRRRAKKKLPARVAFERARALFADLGATQWLERSEAELRRIGGRPTTRFELTETETQVAALVARGMTNREVADALFVSVATVQASLKHIYSKVGVRSRTELAVRLARPERADQ